MGSQKIHTSFETIEKYDQDYRISTEVTFLTSGTYRCKAFLWKSNNGKVRGEPLDQARMRTHDESDVEETLQECVDKCKQSIEAVERAKLLEIDVTVT